MARRRKPPANVLPLGDDVAQWLKTGFQPGLVDRYAIPPFSVLDARQGYWQARKSLWIALGIRSELGRGEGVLMDSDAITTENLNYYRNREKVKSHGSTPAPVGEGGLSESLAPRKGNNLLGMSEATDAYRQGKGNYRKGEDRLNRASPGGSPRPAMDYSNRERGTGAGAPIPGSKAKGKGKADARAFGLDMMRGEGADRYDYVGKQGRDRYGTDTTREYPKADDNVIPTGTGPAVFSDGAINPYLARSRKPTTTVDAGRGAALAAPMHPYDRERVEEDDEVSVMGTSIFDPVLTELLYCWFSPPGAQVLDPFAGGSVRGIVAAALGRHYTGIDLRPEQVEANEAQWETIGTGLPGTARWLTGDARDVLQLVFDPVRTEADPAGDGYDFILTCPPYFDLEQYSYDPADLSNAGDYEEFLRGFRDVIQRSCSLLANNRFAAVVVGDVRDDKGFYRNFPAHTISLFQKYGGMTLYNEAILVTAVGSLPVRIGKQFDAGRKLGKTHQNILIFYKGDPKQIRPMLGDIQMGHDNG